MRDDSPAFISFRDLRAASHKARRRMRPANFDVYAEREARHRERARQELRAFERGVMLEIAVRTALQPEVAP